jgi:hypothetical protein
MFSVSTLYHNETIGLYFEKNGKEPHQDNFRFLVKFGYGKDTGCIACHLSND